MKNYKEKIRIEELEYIDFKAPSDRLGHNKVNYWYVVALVVLFVVYSAI